MGSLIKGRYRITQAGSETDVKAAQHLRALAFNVQSQDGLDKDRFDDACTHFLVSDIQSGALVCCFRLLPLASGAEISRSYSAQYYNLSRLESYQGKMVEMGRFCLHPDASDPDILRIAWGAMATYIDETDVKFLFGCTSFEGTGTEKYRDAFAWLKLRHLAPDHWLPQVRAPEVFRFAARLRRKPDAKKAMQQLPPLLRTYLLMGGWVSDHAVVDAKMNTLHVFTGLEIGAIPPARKKLLRAVSG